jgi:hypothetical protein
MTDLTKQMKNIFCFLLLPVSEKNRPTWSPCWWQSSLLVACFLGAHTQQTVDRRTIVAATECYERMVLTAGPAILARPVNEFSVVRSKMSF